MENIENNLTKVSTSQEQIHDLIFNKEIQWKEIILDLINTEQLDPWDIDIGILAERFFEKVQQYEELDFFVSSKVLLAAALLLRLKSELILSKYLRSIDDILFGNTEENVKRSPFERIELDETIPELILKSPMPRYRRVTLNELIESLNKAIITENRRIKKTIVNQNALRETGIVLPKRDADISNKMKLIHSRLVSHFDANVSHKKISYTTFIGLEKEERTLSFFPLLQLESNGEIWLDQEKNFDEIYIWLKHVFLKENPNHFDDLKLDLSELNDEELKRLEEINDSNLL